MRSHEFDGPPPKKKLKRFSEFASSRAKKIADKVEQLDEGRGFIKVNNREQIGVDQPHVPGQQEHAHLPNGRAVNKDGSISHGGEPFTMKKSWADALRRHDFDIAQTRLVESEGGQVAITLDAPMIEFLTELQAFVSRAE